MDWADVSPLRPGFIPWSVKEGLTANKVARTGFSQRALIFPVSSISPMFRKRSSFSAALIKRTSGRSRRFTKR